MSSMTTTPAPLVTREELRAFTRQPVECYAPEKVILYSCGEACGYGSWLEGRSVFSEGARLPRGVAWLNFGWPKS